MIPVAAVEPVIPRPLPAAKMPSSEEISEEGFGGFRNTWSLGWVPVKEAVEIVSEEAALIDWLDGVAQTNEEFEALATTIESSEVAGMSETVRDRARDAGLESIMRAPDDFAPLGGLEIGVAGLAHALSAIRCPTAASCRSHTSDRSWSDCPVVFFAAPSWCTEILATLVDEAGCGIGADRGLLTIYGPSVRHTHRAAEVILRDRNRFP